MLENLLWKSEMRFVHSIPFLQIMFVIFSLKWMHVSSPSQDAFTSKSTDRFFPHWESTSSIHIVLYCSCFWKWKTPKLNCVLVFATIPEKLLICHIAKNYPRRISHGVPPVLVAQHLQVQLLRAVPWNVVRPMPSSPPNSPGKSGDLWRVY